MATMKPFQLPPRSICIQLLLAIFSSFTWFTAFINYIPNQDAESPNRLRKILLEVALSVVYLIHFAVTVSLPICSRPWLWNLEWKRTADYLEISMIAMGYDDYDGEHWSIGGTRSLAAFAAGIIPFLLPIDKSPWGFAAIVALAAESFFLAEMVKHTEMQEGFFYAAMVGATASARRVFGFTSWESFIVILLCLTFIFFHSLLPFYDEDEFLFAVPDSAHTVAERT